MPHESIEAVERLSKSNEIKGRALALHSALGSAYFSGIQWCTPGSLTRTGQVGSDGRQLLNYTPSSSQLRVMDNFTTQYTQLVEAGSFPLDLPVTVSPWKHDINTSSVHLSQIVTDIVEREKEFWGSVEAARYANFMAAIAGGHLVILELAQEYSYVDDEPVPDWSLRWRTCPVTDLILDPANDMPNLRMHDEVCIRYIYTLGKLKRMYGISIDPENAKTIGELVPEYVKASQLTGGRMFADYALHSETKGVVLYQLHRKSDPMSRRFDKMSIVLDALPTGKMSKSMVLLNEGREESPFGYDGLPVALVNYFQRSGSPVGDGVTHQIMSDQDRQNLSTTLYTLGLAHSATPSWLIDTRVMSQELYNQRIGNTIGGPIYYRGRVASDNALPPTSIRTADPSPAHLQVMDRIPESARGKVHRSAMHMGIGKSHVPDVTTNRLLEESDKVVSRVVEQHASVYADLYRVCVGTMRLAIDQGSPSMLQRWMENGFDEEQLVAFKSMDPYRLNLDIVVPRQSVRMRSPEEKKREILGGMNVANPLMTREEARFALAVDAHSPITESDRRIISFASRSAERIISGETWEPLAEVDHAMIIHVFRQALYNYNGQDPSGKNRILRAIEAQSAQRDAEMARLQQMQEGPKEPELAGLNLAGLMET